MDSDERSFSGGMWKSLRTTSGVPSSGQQLRRGPSHQKSHVEDRESDGSPQCGV